MLVSISIFERAKTAEDGGNRRGEIGEFKEEKSLGWEVRSPQFFFLISQELNHNSKDRKKEALKKAW